MKKLILLTMVFAVLLLSLGGCYWRGYDGHGGHGGHDGRGEGRDRGGERGGDRDGRH